MNNKILCSTGTLIGRVNGYDHRIALRYRNEIHCDGFELMILPAWYGSFDDIAADFAREKMRFDVLHVEKEIGAMLGLGGDEAVRAIGLFGENCRMAMKVGAQKIVLHLWGGQVSDSNIQNNLVAYGTLCEMAEAADLVLTVENIPCTTHDPLSNFERIRKIDADARFTFDTRFGAFHAQLQKTVDNELVFPHIEHMHVSDYGGTGMEWGKIRPILHPTEGVVDFDTLFSKLRPIYNGTVTLESPVMHEGGHDIQKLNRSLEYIRARMS